jgi:AcrR family transcriptional regulator
MWQAVAMSAGMTPRQAARIETIQRIKELALAQLAESSATELSLRAIARELNIVSSGIYRYFPSRDELITALIIDAYDDLARTLEGASTRARSPRRRWVGTCDAMRRWALTAPHRFTLIYGSAIPGYRAPEATIASAARVVGAFVRPVAGAGARPSDSRPVPASLTATLDAMAGNLRVDLDRLSLLLAVRSFSQLIGLLTLELNGHLVGSFEPADAVFTDLVAREADALGL